jgi:hypothetical protein
MIPIKTLRTIRRTRRGRAWVGAGEAIGCGALWSMKERIAWRALRFQMVDNGATPVYARRFLEGNAFDESPGQCGLPRRFQRPPS